jgi:ABC-type Fe3+/spermidine/putrescine transport system ATPase subunit
MSSIVVKGINKSFSDGKVTALSDVNLKIENGEYAVLLGPSGCGKTTLLKTIAGILEPDEGSIYMGNKDVTKLPPEDRDIGFVFQDYALFPHLNVLQNTMYGPLVRGKLFNEVEKTAHEMLELVGLAVRYDAFPRELSGGMKQRLGVARALTTGSPLLLLDEPLSALDAKIGAELRFELRKMAKDLKLTAIHVTHNQEEAMAVADKIIVMRHGRIMQVGTPSEVYYNPSSLFVASFLGEANFLTVIVREKEADILGRKVKFDRPNGRYIVAIRPEKLRLKKGETGEVKNVRLIGGYNRHEIELDGTTLITKSPSLFYGKVDISFNPHDVLIYEYPKEGLMRAIAAE